MLTKRPTVAVPNGAVERYREWCQVYLDDFNAARDALTRIFESAFHLRVPFSKNFGRDGFGIPFSHAGKKFWLICNEDLKTNFDYVAVTLYTDQMFQERQAGRYFKSDTFNKVSERSDIAKLGDVIDKDPNLTFLVQWGEEEEEFDSHAEVLKHLEKLMDRGFKPTQWRVWKAVKTGITVEG